MASRIINDILIFFCLVLLTLGCTERQKTTEVKAPSTVSSLHRDWSISSTNIWLAGQGLMNVESVIYDSVNEVYYATNGEDYALGTSGFISSISEEGTLIELKWVSELNRPTGMAICDSLLYVADVNSLVVIDTRSGRIVERYLEPVSNSGLNDVAINSLGEVFVSASFVHSVFVLKNDKLELWSQDEEKLKWANGIIANDNELIVAGLNLSITDVKSKEISQVQLKGSVEDFDGIVSDGREGYFLTTVEKRGLYHIDEDMNITKLLEEDIYFGDIDFDPQQKRLYVPRGNGKTNEFFISVFSMKNDSNE